MGVYIPNVDYYDLYNWLWDTGHEHILDNCTIISTPHGDLKDFSEVVSYRIGADISHGGCGGYDASDLIGWIILDKDWQNVPTVVEAEE